MGGDGIENMVTYINSRTLESHVTLEFGSGVSGLLM